MPYPAAIPSGISCHIPHAVSRKGIVRIAGRNCHEWHEKCQAHCNFHEGIVVHAKIPRGNCSQDFFFEILNREA